MFKKKKFYLLIVLSLILLVVGCSSSDSDDYVDEEAHGLKVAIDIPQNLTQAQDVNVLTIEEHTTFQEIKVTLEDSEGNEVDNTSKSISDKDNEVVVGFEDLTANKQYEVKVELIGTIREDNVEKTLYQGNATSPTVESDAVVDVDVDVEPLNAKSLTVNISGDEDGVSEVILNHPDKDEMESKGYTTGEDVVFEDGTDLDLMPARWHLKVHSSEGEEAITTPLLLPTEEKVIDLEVSIDGGIDIKVNVATSPDAPQNLEVVDGDLKWDEVTGADTYTVYKTESEDVDNLLSVETVDDNFLSNVEEGYHYWVRAYVDGYSSGLSDALIKEESNYLTAFKSDHSVTSLAFSPDGKQMVSGYGARLESGSASSSVRVWDTETGEQLTYFGNHNNIIASVDFSPNGDKVVSGDYDDTARVWDAETGEELILFNEHDDSVMSVKFSPDGDKVVSGSSDNTVRVWDTETGEQLTVFNEHDHLVVSLDFSPDGDRVVSGSHDDTFRVWDVDTGEELTSVDRGSWVSSVAFSPCGDKVVYGQSSGWYWVQVWDLEAEERTTLFNEHDTRINSVDFSPDGDKVVSGASKVRIWDVETGEELMSIDHGGISSLSPDGEILAVGSAGTVRIWESY